MFSYKNIILCDRYNFMIKERERRRGGRQNLILLTFTCISSNSNFVYTDYSLIFTV